MSQPLSREELQILGPALKSVVRTRKNHWDLLKEQILDYGYQEHYPAQASLESSLALRLSLLDVSDRIRLYQLGALRRMSEAEAMAFYLAAATERLLSRARTAAWRQQG